jgi:hypothetical protein
MLDRGALKVGIQVRAGDRGLLHPEQQPDHTSFPQFFNCAELVEQQLTQDTPKRKVYWYLISDSLKVGSMCDDGRELPVKLYIPQAHCTTFIIAY